MQIIILHLEFKLFYSIRFHYFFDTKKVPRRRHPCGHPTPFRVLTCVTSTDHETVFVTQVLCCHACNRRCKFRLYCKSILSFYAVSVNTLAWAMRSIKKQSTKMTVFLFSEFVFISKNVYQINHHHL